MSPEEIAELVRELEDEVNNGGFDQFFFNSAGDRTMETIYALETIGAVKMASILKRAAGKFPGGSPPRDRYARQDVLLKSFPDAAAFGELDGEFYKYPDDLATLLKEYKCKAGGTDGWPRSD
jgi:Domain of unknown function (DUF4375)